MAMRRRAAATAIPRRGRVLEVENDGVSRGVLVVGATDHLVSQVRTAVSAISGSWTVHLADDASGAGRILSESPVQAAVVGLEPALGGIAFLDWLQHHHPQVTRIAAFTLTTPEISARAADAAHLYVSVATEPRDLGHLIGRTVGLQARLSAETLVAFAGSLRRIPSMPRIYAELRSIMANPDFDMDQVAAVISRDPGLAAKTLQVVNSAFYGLRESVSDLPHAVSLLGSKAIASLVLGISMHDQFSVLGAGRRTLDEEWQRALSVSATARSVARAERAPRAVVETAYMAGLLHNAGRLLLAANMTDRFTSVDWPQDRSECLELERSLFGAVHPDIGALLLGTWGLEDDLVEAIAFQAEPSSSLATQFSPLSALHIAIGLSPGGSSVLDGEYLDRLGLTPDPGLLHDPAG